MVTSAHVSERANNIVAIRRISSSPKGWPRRGSKKRGLHKAQRPGAEMQTRGRIPRVGKPGKVIRRGRLLTAVLAWLAEDRPASNGQFLDVATTTGFDDKLALRCRRWSVAADTGLNTCPPRKFKTGLRGPLRSGVSDSTNRGGLDVAFSRATYLARLAWLNRCAHEDGGCAHEVVVLCARRWCGKIRVCARRSRRFWGPCARSSCAQN